MRPRPAPDESRPEMSDTTTRADAARESNELPLAQNPSHDTEEYRTAAGCLTLGGLVIASLAIMVVLIMVFGEPLH